MSNREQIQRRIERSKQKRAAKKKQRSTGSWTGRCYTLAELNQSMQDYSFQYKWSWLKRPSDRKRKHRNRNYSCIIKIAQLNRVVSAEERCKKIQPFGSFDYAFSMKNLLESFLKRRKNVAWKWSVQAYCLHAPLKLYMSWEKLQKRDFKFMSDIRKIILVERGKERNIHAVEITYRVVQGAFCDSCLVPLTQASLIYDNPASVEGKGVNHARKRVHRALIKEARKHGSNFYVETTDFKKFFESIPHSQCWNVLNWAGMDDDLKSFGLSVIYSYQQIEAKHIHNHAMRQFILDKLFSMQSVGLTLGSHISQIMALAVPNSVDHAVKDRLRNKSYVRYMDDTFCTAATKAELKTVGRTIRDESKAIGLKLNPKKTHILKASRGFVFMQVRYFVTPTGGVVANMCKAGIVRMRRKLKKFKKLFDAGVMTLDQIYASFASFFFNTKGTASYRTRKNLLSLYNKLFRCYKTEGVYA